MLYDPKWEKQAETKADPFTLESLIAWLEKQPAAKEYNYEACQSCLMHQYLSAAGITVYSVGPGYYRNSKERGKTIDLPRCFNDLSVAWPRTFGAALARARKLAAQG